MKRAAILTTLTTASMILAFFTQWYILVVLGPGRTTDALFAAMAVPQLVLAIISGSLMHVLVPLMSGESEDRSRQEGWAFLSIITLVLGIIAIGLFVTAAWWSGVLFPGFSESYAPLLARLCRIQLAAMILTGSAGVLWAYHHSRHRFIWVAATGLVSALASLLLLLWLLPIYGVVAAAWLNVSRAALQVAFLIPALGWIQFPVEGRAALAPAWKRIRPLLVGNLYYKTDPVLDRYLSSMSAPGALSLLYLAQQIYSAANQIINSAIAAPLVPLLASHAKAGRGDLFRSVFRRGFVTVALLTSAAYLFLLAAGQKALSLIVGHGGVTHENVRLLWILLVALAGVIIGGSLGQVTSVAFYAKGDTRTPTRLGIITYTVYVPLKVVAYLKFGLVGLAVTTSLWIFANLALQLWILEGRAFLPQLDDNHDRTDR